MPDCLYFVVPCYNDADTLPVTVPVFIKKLDALRAAGTVHQDSRLLLVNDGSADNTWEVIVHLKAQYTCITALNLAYNTGEQNALLAGMFTAVKRADCVITMDSDLQDDIAAVDEMLRHYSDGCELVYGVRKARKEDSLWERFSSGSFYALMRLGRTGLIREHANYRLMSKKAVLLLKAEKQSFYYLPCTVSGFKLKSAVVYHERFERTVGQSGYGFLKKLRLATDALLAHSRTMLPVLGALAVVCCAGGIAATVAAVKGTYSTGLWVGATAMCLLALALFALCAIGANRKKALLKPIAHERFRIKEVLE